MVYGLPRALVLGALATLALPALACERPDDPPPSRPPKEPAVADAAREMPELLEDRWYRSEGGRATALVPALPEGFRLAFQEAGDARTLSVNGPGGAFGLTFLPRQDGLGEEVHDGTLAVALVTASVRSMRRALPYLEPTRASDQVAHAGGACALQLLEGKSAEGVEEIAVLGAVAEGHDVVQLVCRVRKEHAKLVWETLGAKAFESVRVGARVPRLPVLDPGVRLEGVYEGPTTFDWSGAGANTYRWLTLDPRGWCHERRPAGASDLDLEAAYQRDPASVSRYRVRERTLEVMGEGDAVRWSAPLEVKDDRLAIDGAEYILVTRPADATLVLEGAYAATTSFVSSDAGDAFSFYRSRRYVFTKDGRFRFGRAAAMSSRPDPGSFPAPSGFRSWAFGTAEHPVDAGRYRVVGNRLLLLFDDGRRAMQTLFVHRGTKEGLVYIGAEPYLRED